MTTIPTGSDRMTEKHNLVENMRQVLEIIEEELTEFVARFMAAEPEVQVQMLRDLRRADEKLDAALDPIDAWTNPDEEDE